MSDATDVTKGSSGGSTSNGTNNGSANSADSGTETIEGLRARLDEALALAEKNKNEFLYLRAEFDTHRRNAIKERSDLLKYGSERLINEVLSVIDNFDRAIETKVTSENYQSYAKGVEMTAAELKAALGRFGVNELPCVGVAFDPNRHEAVGSEDSPGTAEGHIVRVLRKPYLLHDRLLRPGQVIVSRGKN